MYKLSNLKIKEVHGYQLLIVITLIVTCFVSGRSYSNGYEQGKLDQAKWFYQLVEEMSAKAKSCDTLVQLQFSDTAIYDIRHKGCCESK